jgi:septal ring factor EnvC (AmiA/AmiB activator)
LNWSNAVEDLITKIAVGIGGIGAGAWGMYQKIKADNRSNKAADTTDAAWQHVIATLREEVTRLSERLSTVEEQNRKCEEANHALNEEIIAMKKQLHLF